MVFLEYVFFILPLLLLILYNIYINTGPLIICLEIKKIQEMSRFLLLLFKNNVKFSNSAPLGQDVQFSILFFIHTVFWSE
jgi:hypothetical protein